MGTRRSFLFLAAVLALLPSGCYVTDWRWIWEDDNDHHCQYYSPPPTVRAAAPDLPKHPAP